ncbi:unnamed protein product [Phytophthora fragariaefolia]|uniref:Unnamed protein product n=1 Tax=Phytophthora fragariaefolia TaxID=1490495 RepID=A0A9W6XWY5_9STRA|nr:unnamed protein product [Phytophthora fragariaefolia]
MSQDLMNAIRLADLAQQDEPQLSVRLRGGRVELASASEEQHVDFLGPAENIKRLFKLPYSRSRVSLAVHRVGSTLVVDGELDEGDLPAGFEDLPQDTLQLAQQAEETSHKRLYEKFIYESTVNTQLPPSETPRAAAGKHDGVVPHTKKAKKHAKRAKKASKAKHKLAAKAPSSGDKVQLLPPAEQSDAQQDASSEAAPPSITGLEPLWATAPEPPSADAKQDVHVAATQAATHHPGSSSTSQQKSPPSFIPTETNWFTSTGQHPPVYGDSQTFQRILKWKFNDLKMVHHPAVSLKLHDMDKELSLCTVLDYYLDNVIANIPELAICMHSKGLVRGYKLVETRQIPYMSGTGRPLFDVQDVSMNASMLLKFLQENCSRPNGTYWLHRKEGESSLRLYDVDVLSQGNQLKWKYMMAMLCYRFAARASRLATSLAAGSPQLQQQLQQRQRELLRTCMNLLGEIAQKGGTAHSSICSSVSEQLADTYLRECNQFQTANSADSVSGNPDRDAAIKSLVKAKQYLKASIRLFEECIPNDSGAALTHSDDGVNDDVTIEGELNSGDEDDGGEMGSFMDEELHRLQLKFSSACLELGQLYAGSHKWTDAIKCIVEASHFLSLNSIPDDVQSFDLSSSKQEYVVDALLNNLDFDGVGRGTFLKDKIPICISGAELRCSLLGLIGDMCAQKPLEVHGALAILYDIVSGVRRDLFSSLSENDAVVLTTFKEDAEPLDPEVIASKEEGLMVLSFLAYLRALSPPADSELYLCRDYKEAFKWFERGCKIFSDIEGSRVMLRLTCFSRDSKRDFCAADGVNVALLRANLAHLHKIFAQGKSTDSREEHYQQAIQLCTDALQLLKQSKADMDLHRKVKGELALTYLVWAVDKSSNISSLSSAKMRESEALKLFNKALSLYAELGDQKQIASTHYQIASFYSRMISNTLRTDRNTIVTNTSDGSSSTLTSRMEIARRHYEKALNYFGAVEVGKTFVLIHQELADLHILGGRVEGVEHALLILLNTYEAFNLTAARDSKLEKQEMAALARDIVSKVKTVLHQLIRLSSGGRSGSACSKAKKLEMFKKMYKEVIYYDGYSAGSIVPILGTLRGMYSV